MYSSDTQLLKCSLLTHLLHVVTFIHSCLVCPRALCASCATCLMCSPDMFQLMSACPTCTCSYMDLLHACPVQSPQKRENERLPGWAQQGCMSGRGREELEKVEGPCRQGWVGDAEMWFWRLPWLSCVRLCRKQRGWGRAATGESTFSYALRGLCCYHRSRESQQGRAAGPSVGPGACKGETRD